MLSIDYANDIAKHYTLKQVDEYLADPERSMEHDALLIMAFASENGRLDLVLHMAQNYDGNSRGTDYKDRAMREAAALGYDDIVHSLCRLGADLEYRGHGHGQKTALLLAATYNNIGIVEELIKAGANLEAKDEQGKTALMLARQEGHEEIVNRLLKAGANPQEPNE